MGIINEFKEIFSNPNPFMQRYSMRKFVIIQILHNSYCMQIPQSKHALEVLWNYYSTGEVWLLIGRYLLRLEKLGKL
jgi:hypothetical protein